MARVSRILFCCGSRPELIKIFPVYRKLKAVADIRPLLCITGQHSDLLPPHLDNLGITPDFRLEAMRKGQDLGALMKQLLTQLPEVFEQSRPDIVVIQGDTASAFASAMTAQKKQLVIAHMEAGLRTHDIGCPFPEEIFRQSISALSRWHFCPTEKARQNLLGEKIPQDNIFVTGNTSVDMVLEIYRQEKACPSAPLSLARDEARPFFLITLHRRESQGSPLMKIVHSLRDFAERTPEFDFILPLHPNPVSSNMIRSLLGDLDNVYLTAPLVYPQFVRLMADAYAIVTDSGGVQEEAPSLDTPVVVVRNKTERSEGVENGCLRLAGTERDGILHELDLLINDKTHYKRMQQAQNPFGDGLAADRIAGHLINIVERR